MRWQLTYMLHGLDHPDAVEFIAREVADQQRHGRSTFSLSLDNEWLHRQDRTGQPMSSASRERLRELWQAPKSDPELRKSALRLWGFTDTPKDADLLRQIGRDDLLFDFALQLRLRRGDVSAIGALLQKLEADDGWWWQFARYVWSPALTVALDKALQSEGVGGETNLGWIASELVIRLPTAEAESLLLGHWDRLKNSGRFVQAALYVGTIKLRELASEAIRAAPSREEMLKHLTSYFGMLTKGHPGVWRVSQIESLIPYLDALTDLDVARLWDLCNDRGWFDYRRRWLDRRLSKTDRGSVYLDDASVLRSLDVMLEKDRLSWADHWVDDYLKTGATRAAVVGIVLHWLRIHRGSMQALRVFSAILVYCGERTDLGQVDLEQYEPMALAQEIFDNARFAVLRRSLF